MKKIAIIGIGGRTGTMFAFELKGSADILGVGREPEIKLIEEKNLYIEKGNRAPELFQEKAISGIEFQQQTVLDIILLTTKNPISGLIKYYYQGFKEKIPTLLISQNGIAALAEAKKALKEIFGERAEKIRVVRVILFNPIEKKYLKDKVVIKYTLPVRIVLAKSSGEEGIKDIVEVFRKADIEVKEFPSEEAKNLEYSKLFLNIIGVAAASRGYSVKDGFKNKEIFKEEVGALKEYIKVIKLSGGKFLNFPHYPVKLLATLFAWLPLTFLLPVRNMLAEIVSKGREGKPKDLDEVEYYNGAVVGLGEKVGFKTPFNKKIYQRALERLSATRRN